MIDKGKEFQQEFESMTRANDGQLKDGEGGQQNVDDDGSSNGQEQFVNGRSSSQNEESGSDVKRKGKKMDAKPQITNGGKYTSAMTNSMNNSSDDQKLGKDVKKVRTLQRGNSKEDISNIMKKIRLNDNDRNKKDYIKKQYRKGGSGAAEKAAQSFDKLAKKTNDSLMQGGLKSAFDKKLGNKKKGVAYKLDEEVKDEKGGKSGKGDKKKQRQGTQRSKGQGMSDIEEEESNVENEAPKKHSRKDKGKDDVEEHSNQEDSSDDDTKKKKHHSNDGDW